MEQYEKIEKSITTTYRKKIWKNFVKAISDFEMIQNGDKIAVCISGGKDSMLLAKCMQEIKKHKKICLLTSQQKKLEKTPFSRQKNKNLGGNLLRHRLLIGMVIL